jgi:FSR family fosmidomycin resistance protein-like MFS transporter
LAALAGIGSGAFHPLGASNAAAVSSDEHRNAAMSWYTVSGGIGYGLGPIVGSVLMAVFGPRGTLWLLVPGFTAAGLIWSQMRVVERAREARALVAVAMRTTPECAVGTLFGGGFADRIGQRRVVAGTLLMTIPALLLYVAFPGPQGLFLAALFGFFCDASLSVTLVMAQRLVPGRVGVASGVILGLGFVTGGIGVPITGRIADIFGMQLALASLSVLLVLGSLVALTIPTGRERERAVQPSPARPDLAPSRAARR